MCRGLGGFAQRIALIVVGGVLAADEVADEADQDAAFEGVDGASEEFGEGLASVAGKEGDVAVIGLKSRPLGKKASMSWGWWRRS